MATFEELMADMGFASPDNKGQVKTASASASKEVNDMLANLGLNPDAVSAADEITKEASQERESMSGLQDIYSKMFVETQAEPTGEVTKVASAEDGGEEISPAEALSSLMGVYFNAMEGEFLNKTAGDLESEAGAGHDPLPEHSGGQLTGVIGKAKDPQVAVNYKPNADAKLDTNTKNTSPYTFAAAQQYLKRIGGKEALVGGYKD